MPSFWPTKLNKFSCMDQGGFARWRDLSPALSEVSVSASTPCEAKRSTDVSWTTDYYMTISRKKVSSSPPQNMTRAVVIRWLHVSAHTAVGKCWKAILLHLTKGRKLVSIWHLQAEEKLWKLLTTTLQTASPIIMSFKKKLGSLASNKIWESSKRKYCEIKSGCLHFGRQNSTLRSCATKFARHCSKKHMGSDRHVCSWKRS